MTGQRLRSIRFMILLAPSLLSPLNVHPATSVNIGPLLDQAKNALTQRDNQRAIEALQSALEQVRMAAPLTAKPFLLISEPAKFYGDYKPR